jgi:hypothetical protein
MRKITIEADELARQWNKTRDPSIRDQWFKKVSQVPLIDSHLQREDKKT